MKLRAVLFFAVVLFFASSAFAQRHELGLTIGSAQPEDVRTDAGVAEVKNSFAFQIDYSARIVNFGVVALYSNMPLAVATKNTIDVPSAISPVPRDYRSYFFTPGLKLKVLPKGPVSPYVVGGYGFARIAPRDRATDDFLDIFDRVKEFSQAYSIGGGVDVRVSKNVAVRGEVRRYSTKPFELDDFGGFPGLDLSFLEERQRSVFITGGVVFRF